MTAILNVHHPILNKKRKNVLQNDITLIKILHYTITSESRFKGVFHFKMKILSSFTHPQVVSNLYEYFFCWTQRYFEECR